VIAHHVSTVGLLVELAVIVLVAVVLALVWWRGRRRRRDRPTAAMRQGDPPSG
jgi:hypothetical protein